MAAVKCSFNLTLYKTFIEHVSKKSTFNHLWQKISLILLVLSENDVGSAYRDCSDLKTEKRYSVAHIRFYLMFCHHVSAYYWLFKLGRWGWLMIRLAWKKSYNEARITGRVGKQRNWFPAVCHCCELQTQERAGSSLPGPGRGWHP